jgi:hypothetical protein
MKKEKCCESYNGTLDITNSCIFCKSYIPNEEDKREAYCEWLEELQLDNANRDEENYQSFIDGGPAHF